MTDTDNSAPLKKYYKLFTLLYAGLTVAAGLVNIFVYEMGGFISWVILFCTAMTTAHAFVMDHKRLPSTHEKHRLIWGCLGTSLVVSLILAAFLAGVIVYIEYGGSDSWAALSELLQQANTDAGMVFFLAMLLGLGIALILSYLTLWFTFTFTIKSFLKRELKAMSKKTAASQ